MEAHASELRSTYPASFVLPLSEELGSIDGWLELDPKRVAFRNGQGLELAMRIDRVAGVTLPPGAVDEPAPAPALEEADIDDLPLREASDRSEPLGVMRLDGECGPAHVAWELLISPEDARMLGEELSAALGGTDLRSAGLAAEPEVLTLERADDAKGEATDPDPFAAVFEPHRFRVFGWRPHFPGRPRFPLHPSRSKDDLDPIPDDGDPERRALLVRRRRIVALVILAAVLVVAIELTVTLFLIPG